MVQSCPRCYETSKERNQIFLQSSSTPPEDSRTNIALTSVSRRARLLEQHHSLHTSWARSHGLLLVLSGPIRDGQLDTQFRCLHRCLAGTTPPGSCGWPGSRSHGDLDGDMPHLKEVYVLKCLDGHSTSTGSDVHSHRATGGGPQQTGGHDPNSSRGQGWLRSTEGQAGLSPPHSVVSSDV